MRERNWQEPKGAGGDGFSRASRATERARRPQKALLSSAAKRASRNMLKKGTWPVVNAFQAETRTHLCASDAHATAMRT
eukprot:6173852-Pleurochrysis_carterae.AAC.2